MKAIVLCAGIGSRLRPLTWVRPKHLLPVAGRPVIDHVLTDLREAGVDHAVFVTPPDDHALEEFVGDGARWGIETSFCEQPEPLGLAHALRCATGHVGDDERFLMYLGDDLLGEGVAQFADRFRASEAAASLIVKPVADPRSFGVVIVEDGVVTGLVEKPSNPPSNLAVVGVYGFGPQIWDAIDRISPSARGELEITDAIDLLVRQGEEVTVHVTEGFWADAGSPEALLRANRFFLERLEARNEGEVDGASLIEGRVRIEPGARVEASHLMGPCLIGAGCVVEDSTLGPHVALGGGSRVTRARVADSIVEEDCVVADVPGGIERSVLGRRVTVRHITRDSAVPAILFAADESVISADVGE